MEGGTIPKERQQRDHHECVFGFLESSSHVSGLEHPGLRAQLGAEVVVVGNHHHLPAGQGKRWHAGLREAVIMPVPIVGQINTHHHHHHRIG